MAMAIAKVIKFNGSPDDLVWKFPTEDFNTTSQLIVDETFEAMFVRDGNALDEFPPGRHTLTVQNVPILSKLQNMAFDGVSPFNCKVFFINKVHQMDLLWGTQGTIDLNDPLYDVFLHVGLCGSMTFHIEDARKFMIKCVGFRDSYGPKQLVENFRGIISSHVKNCISKIMINGYVSYFVINANLFEVGDVVRAKLSDIFCDYGIEIDFFNIETITVPEKDYAAITKTKENRAGRIIEGYTWQEERQMAIAEKFASNQGTMGVVGGAMGGFMVGGAMGGTISEIAKNALSPQTVSNAAPQRDVAARGPARVGDGITNTNGFDVGEFFTAGTRETAPSEIDTTLKCFGCGANLAPDSKFCSACGAKTEQYVSDSRCPGCGAEVAPGAKFCSQCGQLLHKKCPACGADVASGGKFCMSCGTKL